MNFKSDQMKGYISPTDSRWRSDLRLYEEGDIEESENQKELIENRQRYVRKLTEEGKLPPHESKFFTKVIHPFIKNNEFLETGFEQPCMYTLVDDDSGYWKRRERQDWDDMPNLWGPWKND